MFNSKKKIDKEMEEDYLKTFDPPTKVEVVQKGITIPDYNINYSNETQIKKIGWQDCATLLDYRVAEQVLIAPDFGISESYIVVANNENTTLMMHVANKTLPNKALSVLYSEGLLSAGTTAQIFCKKSGLEGGFNCTGVDPSGHETGYENYFPQVVSELNNNGVDCILNGVACMCSIIVDKENITLRGRKDFEVQYLIIPYLEKNMQTSGERLPRPK